MKNNISEDSLVMILQMFVLQHEGKMLTDVFPKLKRKNYRHTRLNNLSINTETWAHRKIYYVDFRTTKRTTNLFSVSKELARNGKEEYVSDYYASNIVTRGRIEDIVKTLSFEDRI